MMQKHEEMIRTICSSNQSMPLMERRDYGGLFGHDTIEKSIIQLLQIGADVPKDLLEQLKDRLTPYSVQEKKKTDMGKQEEKIIEAVIKRCPKENLTKDRPKSQQRWCLFDSKEERLLGRHPTKQKAKDQERVVQIHKHM